MHFSVWAHALIYLSARSQPGSNVGRDFPGKKAQTLIRTKGVSKLNFFCFNRLKSVNTSLLSYPCVFCFLNVGDEQPEPESGEEKIMNSLKFCCLFG